ncbi:MAG: hypothetical protein QW424_05405 [Candidatus Bathyarchaeia archaeon]
MSMQISLLIRAVDEASQVVRKVANETSSALKEVEKASESVAQAHKLSWGEAKKLITGFSGLATSAFSLYSAFDRLQDATLNLRRANLQVQASQLQLEQAQKKLNDAISQHNALLERRAALEDQLQRLYERLAEVEAGENERAVLEVRKQIDAVTKEYNKTLEQLNMLSNQIPQLQEQAALAQERYNYAVERAQQVQENYNQMVIQTALTTIPMVITAIDSGVKAFDAIKGSIEMVNAALTFLAANPIMLAIIAITALIGALIWLYQTNEDFRNAVNALGETLLNFFKPVIEAVQAAWEALCGAFSWFYENVLVPIGQFIETGFIAAWNALKAVWDALKGSWDAFVGALKWGYDTFIKPIIDALSWFYENIIKPVAGFFAGLGGRGAAPAPAAPATPGVYGVYEVPGFQHGGIVTKPTLGLLGESGPEAVIPLERFAPSQNIINISLSVEGSVDRRTAEYVINEIEKRLKTVLIEASSPAAPTKRIRLPRGVLA